MKNTLFFVLMLAVASIFTVPALAQQTKAKTPTPAAKPPTVEELQTQLAACRAAEKEEQNKYDRARAVFEKARDAGDKSAQPPISPMTGLDCEQIQIKIDGIQFGQAIKEVVDAQARICRTKITTDRPEFCKNFPVNLELLSSWHAVCASPDIQPKPNTCSKLLPLPPKKPTPKTPAKKN